MPCAVQDPLEHSTVAENADYQQKQGGTQQGREQDDGQAGLGSLRYQADDSTRDRIEYHVLKHLLTHSRRGRLTTGSRTRRLTATAGLQGIQDVKDFVGSYADLQSGGYPACVHELYLVHSNDPPRSIKHR